MPLMAKLPDAVDDGPVRVQLEAETQSLDLGPEKTEKGREEKDSGYEDFDVLDEEAEDSDMEGSIMDRPRPKKAPKTPVLPQRSDKRASKILESVLLELKTLDGTVPAKDAEQLSIVSDPHELYLSSEEDASLSDYEDADSLIDFSPTDGESQSASRSSSRRSQEDTARVVSFTIVTKPQIIQINISRPVSQSPQSLNLESPRPTTTHSSTSYISSYRPHRPAPLKIYPPSTRRLSIASTTSAPFTYHSNQSASSLPPRKSSKLNLSTIVSTAKNSFLASDPFASPSQSHSNDDDLETPKTPTSVAAAAFKKSLSKSMSKRKPSMSKLSGAFKEAQSQRDSLRLARELALEESRAVKERMMVQRAETMPIDGERVLYKDIMKAAGEVIRSPTSPVKEKERKMSMGHKMSLSMGLVRKKSIKGRGDRYLE